MPRGRRASRSGFTLIELLVVIGIIVLLVSILMPVVSQVRIRAAVSATQAEMMRIMTACQNYYHDFSAYPGPIADANLSNTGIAQASKITSSENLTLGLFGWLNPPQHPGQQVTLDIQSGTNPPQVYMPPRHDVLGLNVLHPASYHYMDFLPDDLSNGYANALEYAGGNATGKGPSTDSLVPEFIDKISSPMPILYVRARAGNPPSSGTTVVGAGTQLQYDYTQLQDYGCFVKTSSGAAQWQPFKPSLFSSLNGLSLDSQPYSNFNDYFTNHNLTTGFGSAVPIGKDSFILISAGPDRIYGTHDDIIVAP